MGKWHPPIPAEAVYSDEVDALGPGLRLLWYCYNCLERDGTLVLSLTAASDALGKKYETVRNWWQLLKVSGIVSVLEDRGRSGYLLRIHDDWIDWHVLNNNYTNAQRANMPVEKSLNGAERSLNGFSTVAQRSDLPVETAMHGSHDPDHQPPPPNPPAPAARAGGGGGSEHPTETQRALVAFGFSAKNARRFRDLPLDAVQAELKAAKARGSGPGSLVLAWDICPPTAPPPPEQPANLPPAYYAAPPPPRTKRKRDEERHATTTKP